MKTIRTKKVCKFITISVSLFMPLECAAMSTTEQRLLSGGASSGGTGTALGAISGRSVGTGAVMANAAGTVWVYL